MNLDQQEIINDLKNHHSPKGPNWLNQLQLIGNVNSAEWETLKKQENKSPKVFHATYNHET